MIRITLYSLEEWDNGSNIKLELIALWPSTLISWKECSYINFFLMLRAKENKYRDELKNYVINGVDIYSFFFIKLMLNDIIEMEIAHAP